MIGNPGHDHTEGIRPPYFDGISVIFVQTSFYCLFSGIILYYIRFVFGNQTF